MRGVVPVGYAVFAVLLGTLVGLLLRRSVPAMALTLAIYVVSRWSCPLWVRPHLVPPTSTYAVISGDTLDGIGARRVGPVPDHHPHRRCPRLGADQPDRRRQGQGGRAAGLVRGLPAATARRGHAVATPQVSPAPGTMDRCFTRLTDEGYRQHLVYHPRDHFWPLQWAETGLYLVAVGRARRASASGGPAGCPRRRHRAGVGRARSRYAAWVGLRGTR